jgi:tRNA A37 threonylcarbamoyladenosine modification protein TsaB
MTYLSCAQAENISSENSQFLTAEITIFPMKTLVFETSSEKSLIALLEWEQVVASAALNGGPSLSTTIGTEVKKILDNASGRCDQIVLGAGPGSYTGVRIGAALALGLSFSWNLPLLAAPSLCAFSNSLPVAADAKGGGIYLLLPQQNPCKVSLKIAAELLSPYPAVATPHPALLAPRLPSCRFLEATPDPLLLTRAAREISPEQLDLLYLDLER